MTDRRFKIERNLRFRCLSRALLVLTSCISIPLSSCVLPIHETDRFSAHTGVQTLSVDAKQRVVLFSKRPDPDPVVAKALADAAKDAHSKDLGLITVTCAEPSPDALSALSTSVGGSVTDPKVALNLAIAASESAASIGLRTQSIQLLRDGMYRLCEAYAGRALDGPEYNRQLRRYQNLMLGLLAVEQITGAVVARQATLGDGSAGASVGENADKAAADATAAASAVDDAQKALTSAQATQTSDEASCKADATNPACGKAAGDASDVSTKQAALDTAKKKAETAKLVLQAARGAVTASAAGAHAALSDQTKTNSISDGSARYIAEATRTIVATTIIASFAQEECSRLWDFVAATPKEFQPQLLLGTARLLSLDGGGKTEDQKNIQKQAQQQAVDEGVPIAVLAANCGRSQDNLLQRAAFFTPDYGSPPPPLEVLGADAAVPMAVGGPPVDLRIIGGTPPFEAIVPSNFKLELEAIIPPAKGAVRTIHITRPSGASKTGAASVIVIDANNVHVEIPITLTSKAVEQVKPAAVLPPTGVTASAAGGGKITVKFTPPKAGEIKGFAATATTTDGSNKVLTAEVDKAATSIDILNCVAGTSYNVTVETVPLTGNHSAKAKATGTPPKCDMVTPPPVDKALGPPTAVKSKALAGGKFEVSFKAPPDDGQGAVNQYTVKTSDLTDTKQKVPDVSGASSPITVTGCKAKDQFAISVIATRAGTNSAPAVETEHRTCLP